VRRLRRDRHRQPGEERHPRDEILCSLADAIVLQNLSVLTRGSTLKHKVLLLGGPNTYLPFLQECWRLRIPQTWDERGYDYPKDVPIEELVFVPENAQYYAAFGACVYGLREARPSVGVYAGLDGLVEYMTNGRKARLGESARARPREDPDEIERLRRALRDPEVHAAEALEPGQVVRGGHRPRRRLDLVEGRAGRRARRDRLQGLPALQGQPDPGHEGAARAAPELRVDQGATLEVLGFGATGYAADVLRSACAPT
jgi:hypothetical protein